MPDYNVVLSPGDINQQLVNAVIEIPTGSYLKVEYDRQLACFKVDRVEPKIYPKPMNYGFIPQTLDLDGDELDIIVITEAAIPTGVWLECRVVGVLNFIDDGEEDYKILAVPSDDRNSGDSIKSLADINERFKQQLVEHFTHYKDLKKPGATLVQGYGSIDDAMKIIRESIERYKKA